MGSEPGRPPGEPSRAGGGADAFQTLYRGHAAALFAYLLRRCPSPVDAQDALAETFLVAWRRPDQVPGGDAARLWLYGVARRVVANQRRGDRRRQQLAVRLEAQRPETVVPGPDPGGEVRDVMAALTGLSEGDREILRLAAWEGLSHPEIAAILGCSENASAIRLHRARARLRRAYAKERGSSRTQEGKYGDRDSGKGAQ